ncbi:CYTH domain-containing protein [uncultured Bifidobacterium sp.]|uniref:CYTH domain-containing protein n=1 Tax=uncultured Bifidobacterium sp. TaxID=165187 RepID=UPI002633A4F3|nr:CYTH domain-containing protein [uncultured Bifidobacterium sp.]
MNTMTDFEFERRFFCAAPPQEVLDETPTTIVQSYFVHQDNYALRVRVMLHDVHEPMTSDMDARLLLQSHLEQVSDAFVTVKGPSVGGTRYEAEREIDSHIATELILRGGSVIVKNRFSIWLGEDGWSIDVFGGNNHPLVIAEAERSGPVTNLAIPSFCVSEITDQRRFSNDGLASRPFNQWKAEYRRELDDQGPHFEQAFGHNRRM